MNNKGQTLVIFVILLPIIFLVLGMVVDVGMLNVTKKNMNDNIRSSIEFGLSNINHNETKSIIEKMLNNNIKNSDCSVILDDHYIKVSCEIHYQGIFHKLIGNSTLISTYIGTIDENKDMKIIKE